MLTICGSIKDKALRLIHADIYSNTLIPPSVTSCIKTVKIDKNSSSIVLKCEAKEYVWCIGSCQTLFALLCLTMASLDVMFMAMVSDCDM